MLSKLFFDLNLKLPLRVLELVLAKWQHRPQQRINLRLMQRRRTLVNWLMDSWHLLLVHHSLMLRWGYAAVWLISYMLATSVKSLVVWCCLLATLREYMRPVLLWHLGDLQKSNPDVLLLNGFSDDNARAGVSHYVIWQLTGFKSLCIIANPLRLIHINQLVLLSIFKFRETTYKSVQV